MSNRQKIELEYHDKKALNGNQFYYGGSQNEYYKYFYSLVDNVQGLKVLDLGCGDGWFSNILAGKGAHVIGIDISLELLKKALNETSKIGPKPICSFAQMAAEDLAFSDNTFDIVIGSAILHHTDIESTSKDIYRVLRKDGKAIFIEPMNQNLILKLWRLLTPSRRSPTEKALNTRDLVIIEKYYIVKKRRYFVMASIISEGLLILGPGKRLLTWIDVMLSKIDSILLKTMPFLGKYSAVVVLELKK